MQKKYISTVVDHSIPRFLVRDSKKTAKLPNKTISYTLILEFSAWLIRGTYILTGVSSPHLVQQTQTISVMEPALIFFIL